MTDEEVFELLDKLTQEKWERACVNDMALMTRTIAIFVLVAPPYTRLN